MYTRFNRSSVLLHVVLRLCDHIDKTEADHVPGTSEETPKQSVSYYCIPLLVEYHGRNNDVKPKYGCI